MLQIENPYCDKRAFILKKIKNSTLETILLKFNDDFSTT